ncbi:MAG: alpha/beta hydrolase [Rubrivivax sp.]|nr:alpha/beta hydrolase [Rubrivivax sp.]
MAKPKHLRPADLRGTSQLAVDATLGLVDLVENLHHNISRTPWPLGQTSTQPTRGITGLVYRSIRGVTRLVGGSVDALLGQLLALLGSDDAATIASPEREAVLAALNGVLGDHLAARANPLATPMSLRHDGQTLRPGSPVASPRRRWLLTVHGLCMGAAQWRRNGHDHGEMLAEALGASRLALHYNSGLHISQNGRELAAQLEALLGDWPLPVDEIVILGHSMGGLVARSACQQAEAAGHRWRQRLKSLVFLGSPHHGAPLERGGHWVDTLLGASPYTAAFARLGQLRSAGITDLRHGRVLDPDWADAPAARSGSDTRVALPLPAGVACFSAAASLSTGPGGKLTDLLGDGLVPLASAHGQHADPARCLHFDAAHQWTGYGLHHLDLLDDAAVAAQLRRWLV